MPKTMMIVGFGPGTARAVAEKFGAEGFSLALVARNQSQLATSVAELKTKGIDATAFTADAGDPAAIRSTIQAVRSQMAPITVLFWNAYAGLDVSDLLTADESSIQRLFNAPVFGLIAATKELLPDLKQVSGSAILVSNGGLSDISTAMDAAATQYGFTGIALSGAAKLKLVGLIAERLKADGIYVGEIVVHGTIKSTPGAADNTIDPTIIADKYWELYESRSQTRADIK
jgi:short-subunit dehydrogenase